MALIKTTEGNEYHIDDKLLQEIETKVKPALTKQDKDICFLVDGQEASGKSWFAIQLAKAVDPSFNIDRICFTSEEFRDAILTAEKFQAIIFDEAFVGLSSRSSLSDTNQMLVSLMMQCRQKNLFLLVVLPSFFLLDKYAALWRSRGLFHIVETARGRRMWVFYDRRNKELLYLYGKKTYDYKYPKSYFRGWFYNKFALGEEAEINYRKKKEEALMNVKRLTRKEKATNERNNMIKRLHRQGKTIQELEDLTGLKKSIIYAIVGDE